MTDTTPSALCPGCFNDKGTANPCPHCGYDEAAPRGPLLLPHRTLLNGQFLIGRVLGKPGGFGITYLGWDLQLATRVAIKEYLPRELAGRSTDQATVAPHTQEESDLFRYGLEQFLREARTLAQLDHPNIVRVRHLLEANGTAYLVMDYYDGLSLAEYLDQQGGRLAESTASQLLLPILDGLREVHAQDILHRDVKPSNIYLAHTRVGGVRPILLDFGAARQAVGERSHSLSVVVSAGYAPFEQYQRRGRQGAWTDIYSAAAVLYRAVTGVAPPDANDRILDDPLQPASAFGVSQRLSDALETGLAMAPEARPQSVREFQALLRDKGAVAVSAEPAASRAASQSPEGGQSKQQRASTQASAVAHGHDEMSVAEFARLKRLPEAKVVDMIRDGFYIGRVVNGAWFVNRDELGDSDRSGTLRNARQATRPTSGEDEITVTEFARRKGLPEAKVIDMIRDGFYTGRLVNGAWFVSRDELGKSKARSRGNASANLVASTGEPGTDETLGGISGWLVLPAIGLILGCVAGPIGLLAAVATYSEVADAGYGGVFTLEILVLVGLLAFTVYAATRFFRKMQKAPSLMIALYVVSPIASLFLLAVELSAGAEEFAAETGQQLILDLVAAAIWIPYFKVSKRVKATFVR